MKPRDHKRANSSWSPLIPDKQWSVYLDAIRAARKTGARFMLGGAFGLAGYTGRLRNTKDLDFFVLPSDKDKIVDALTKAGFDDYYPELAYDRGWIYRATLDGVIVDTIWQTPNRRAEVDEAWLKRSRIVSLRNEELEILPAEELLAIKLFVLQRDRCDWPDLINLLWYTCGDLDWDHIIYRMGPDLPLLAGLLQLFNWVAPGAASCIPENVRKRFALPDVSAEDYVSQGRRVELLDSRPWFAAFQPEDKPMEL
jgi:hypothetical protein